MAKRILTKEKVKRQLAGKSSSTPFINIRDGYVSKKITFNTQDGLEEKLDRLTSMMNKLTTQDDSQNKQFKPKIYQGKRRGQTRNFYDRLPMIKAMIKIAIDQTMEIEEYCSVE